MEELIYENANFEVNSNENYAQIEEPFEIVSNGIFDELNQSKLLSNMCNCICCDSPCCIKN